MAAITSAVVGIGGGLASSIGGFIGAAKQNKAAQAAEREAKKSIADARRRAGQKVYEELSIPMEAYAQEYEAQLQSDMQALSALQQADSRALIGGVGRIGAQQTQEAAATRTAMADEMFNLEKLKADEEAAIKQQNIALDVAEAQMADQRAYEAQQMRQQAIQQGFGGLTTAATALSDVIDPFAKLGAGKAAGGADMPPTAQTAKIGGPSGVQLGTPVQAIAAPEKFTEAMPQLPSRIDPFTVESGFQGSGLRSSGGVTTVPTFGTAGLTMFPGGIPLAPPKYNQPFSINRGVYDRRGRLIRSLSE